MAPTSTRVFIDCGEMPSDSNCTLKISGTPEEVEKAAVAHAVAAHGRDDTPELHEMIKAGFQAEAA